MFPIKRRSIGFWGLAAIACLLSLLVSCSKPVEAPFRVGSITWLGYEPLYLAQSLNYFQETPVQILNYPSSTEVIRAFRNGELEVAALTLDETLSLKQTEPDIQVFLIADISNGADVILAKPDIPDLQSLRGKRVGVETTAMGAYVLTRALEKTGLTPADVAIVPLGASEHEQAYKQNRVDAIVTFEPTRSALLREGAHTIFDSSQIPNEIVDVLATHQSTLQQRPLALKALVSGWFQSLGYVQDHADDAIARMANRAAASPNDFADALKLIHIPTLRENQELLSNTNPSLSQSAENLVSVMLQQKLLNQKVDATDLLTDEVVKSLDL